VMAAPTVNGMDTAARNPQAVIADLIVVFMIILLIKIQPLQ